MNNLKDKLCNQVWKQILEQFYWHVDCPVDGQINSQINGLVRDRIHKQVFWQVQQQVHWQCLNMVKNEIDAEQSTRWKLLKLKGLRLINNLTRYK